MTAVRMALAFGALFGVAAPMQACVDTTPLDFPSSTALQDGAASGALADGPTVATDADLVGDCRRCLTAGACKAQSDVCTADSKCNVFVNCLIDAYCLNYSFNDLAHLPACLIQCGAKASVLGQDDPALADYTPLAGCAQSACGASCNVRGDR